MSRSCRYVVKESSISGWFNVVDSKDGFVCAQIRGRSEANARARNLNSRVGTPSPKPVGYIEVQCLMCPAALFALPNGSHVCPKCRDEIEAKCAWMDTREGNYILDSSSPGR